METYRHGALHVVEQARPKNDLQRELRSLDSRLFLEKQVTLGGDVVWCVVIELSGGEPPATILEWRGPEGEPIELTSGIVERIRKMIAQGDASEIGREAARRNQELIERRRREHFETMQELAAEHAAYARRALRPLGTANGISSPKVLANRRAKRNAGHWRD